MSPSERAEDNAVRRIKWRLRHPITNCKCGNPLSHGNAAACDSCTPPAIRRNRATRRARYKELKDARESQAPGHSPEDSAQRP